MNIEKELQEYRQNLSRLKYFRKELLSLMSPKFFPDSVSYYSSPVFDNPIISEINKFHSITENAGIKLEKVNKKIEEKKDRIKKDIRLLQDRIQTLEILLESLNNQEEFIIKTFYFNGLQWFLVAIEYQKKYGQPISTQQLKTRRTAAIKKMEGIMR